MSLRRNLQSLPPPSAWVPAIAATLASFAPGLALAAPPVPPPPVVEQAPSAALGWTELLQTMVSDEVVQMGWRVALGILIFIGGWLLAKFFAWIVFRMLVATELDNKLAKTLGVTMLLEEQGSKAPADALERGVAKVVYWLLMALVIVGVLEFAGLQQAAGPIQRLVDTVIQAIPLLAKAALILVVAYVAASILRLVVRKFVNLLRFDQRFAELDEPEAPAEGPAEASRDAAPAEARPSFSESASQVVFWLVMVLGFAGALDALRIEALSIPLSNAINTLISLLPMIAVAALIGVGGWVLSRIARAVVTNLLQALRFDELVARVRLAGLFGSSTPSKVAGWLAMAFVLIQTAIAVFHQLGLDTLSQPLTAMMAQFWAILPALTVSVLFVILGVFLGRLLRAIVSKTLTNIGFDRLMTKIGVGKIAEREDELGTPSGLAGFVVQVAVILLALVQGLHNLQLGTWAGYVDALLVFAVTRAFAALVIVVLGFALGNYVRDLIRARQAPEVDGAGTAIEFRPMWIAEFARSAVLVFAFTMAVQQLGVAQNFVLASFALLFGGLCLAAALAFGLGGREVAGEIVRERWNKANKPGSGTAPRAPGASLFGNKPPL